MAATGAHIQIWLGLDGLVLHTAHCVAIHIRKRVDVVAGAVGGYPLLLTVGTTCSGSSITVLG